MRLTLPIKKQYFDEILSGSKTTEYRAASPYYRNRLKTRYKTLRLHYYRSDALEADIVKVRLIDTPKHLLKSGISFPKKVYAISLKNARRVRSHYTCKTRKPYSSGICQECFRPWYKNRRIERPVKLSPMHKKFLYRKLLERQLQS